MGEIARARKTEMHTRNVPACMVNDRSCAYCTVRCGDHVRNIRAYALAPWGGCKNQHIPQTQTHIAQSHMKTHTHTRVTHTCAQAGWLVQFSPGQCLTFTHGRDVSVLCRDRSRAGNDPVGIVFRCPSGCRRRRRAADCGNSSQRISLTHWGVQDVCRVTECVCVCLSVH